MVGVVSVMKDDGWDRVDWVDWVYFRWFLRPVVVTFRPYMGRIRMAWVVSWVGWHCGWWCESGLIRRVESS